MSDKIRSDVLSRKKNSKTTHTFQYFDAKN